MVQQNLSAAETWTNAPYPEGFLWITKNADPL